MATAKRKQIKVKTVQQKKRLFRSKEPLFSVFMWGINHTVNELGHVNIPVMLMPDDFKAYTKVRVDNHLFNKIAHFDEQMTSDQQIVHQHQHIFADENQFRSIIVWLEDQKIRHYKIEDRATLRNISSPDWVKALQSYLMDLDCPYQQSEKNCVIEWLLAYAVRLEYGDNVDKYKGVTAETLKQATTKPAPGVSSNPLDNLNFDDPDFKAGIASLSVLLQIPPHQDHVEMLKAICLLVKNKLSKEAIEQVSKDTGKVEHIALDQMELGFDTGDYIINEAAKVLRLIHLHDLRELQTTINQAIVGVQNVTANPKTDSRLGKVGR